MADTLIGSKIGKKELILASSSATRVGIFQGAGLVFKTERPTVDEATIRRSMIASGADVESGAARLADLKALEISAKHPAGLVVGADQILEHEGAWFEKPVNIDQARNQLEQLSGGQHRLISSVAVALNNSVIWRHTDHAVLNMRTLSEGFLTDYLQIMGDRLLSSVGGYQIESLGAQLFDSVTGDYFTILGLPLLPVLKFLREKDVLGT
jgi:septum formation protein